MKASIPIFVFNKKQSKKSNLFLIHLLFYPDIQTYSFNLKQGMTELKKKLQSAIRKRNKNNHHGGLTELLYVPDYEVVQKRISLYLEKEKTFQLHVLFIIIKCQGHYLACAPAFDNLWFPIPSIKALDHSKSTSVIHEYVNDNLNRSDKLELFDFLSYKGNSRIMTISQTVSPEIKGIRQEEIKAQASFFDMGDGSVDKLHDMGYCLNWDYPSELSRALLRDKEIKQIIALLNQKRKKPILIIGQQGVGKTCLIHELIFQMEQENELLENDSMEFWLISPQRLISGMSYIGQWEKRTINILNQIQKKNRVLYLDNFLSIFQSGQSANSDLCIAHILKRYIQKQSLYFIAELTLEQLYIFREKDRSFADQFTLIHVNELSYSQNLEILIESIQELEMKHECQFHPDVLPKIISHTQRYYRHQVLPGKVMRILKRMAFKYTKQNILPHMINDELHFSMNLNPKIHNAQTTIHRDNIFKLLNEKLLDQDHAIHEITDMIYIMKAQLNDPTRPLHTFLFLGPTGVGKTECAKAMASVLFTNEEQLIRFDMNEFVEPDAVDRLIGNFYSPHGLLTNAIRQSPFSILLLDEIEKAHPLVFDMLLQVLDDGRLTDANGHVVDFTHTIIIMTSNLGSTDTRSKPGFYRDREDIEKTYIRAAKNFFRPEFFNRLDKIIPFTSLSRKLLDQIGFTLMNQIFLREGFNRRKYILNVNKNTMSYLIDKGYDPEMGARSLKRSIERLIARPLSRYVAKTQQHTNTIISIYKKNNQLCIGTHPLEETQRYDLKPSTILSEKQFIQMLTKFCDQTEKKIELYKPEGLINPNNISPEYEFYYYLIDKIQNLRAYIDELHYSRVDDFHLTKTYFKSLKPRPPKKMVELNTGEIFAAIDLKAFIDSLIRDRARPVKSCEEKWRSWFNDILLTKTCLDAGPERYYQKVLIHILRIGSVDKKTTERINNEIFSQINAFNACDAYSIDDPETYFIRGQLVYSFIENLKGGHLFIQPDGRIEVVFLFIKEFPINFEFPFKLQASDFFEDCRIFYQDPLKIKLPNIVRIYDLPDTILDLKTGRIFFKEMTSEDYQDLLLQKENDEILLSYFNFSK